MNSAAAVVMVENTVLRQAAHAVWDGLMRWQAVTDAVSRVRQKLRLPCWMYLVIWMNFRSVSDMRLTEK